LSYCDDMCKQRDIRISIYEKATKNCENEHDFWIGYLFELEKNEESGEKIQEIAIKAIDKAGDEGSINFSYEILKHLCEY